MAAFHKSSLVIVSLCLLLVLHGHALKTLRKVKRIKKISAEHPKNGNNEQQNAAADDDTRGGRG